jgi:lipopolysaccharide export system permease protein
LWRCAATMPAVTRSTLLARYVLAEVLVPLANWVVFFFFLFLAMSFLRGTELLLGSAVSAMDLLEFILFLTPHFLLQAMPIAFLLAILLGLGRLSEDGELTAMRALGVGPWKLLAWPMSLAVVLGIASLAVTWTLEPWGMRAVTRSAKELIKRNVMGDVRPEVFYDDIPNFVLYTERVLPNGIWENVLIHDARDPAAPQLLLAQRGHLEPAERDEVKLLLNGGNLHRVNPAQGDYAVADFEKGQLMLSVEGAMGKNTFKRPHEELTPTELLEAAATDPNPLPFLVTFHTRLGRAVMPLAFALLATALALGGRGARRGRGILLSIVAYVLYYVTMQVGAGLGAKGHLPPMLAGQVANLVFLALGAWAMARAAREGTTR